ncbi:MAG: hypothetical protein M0Q53_20430 [Prolixibacteraceae bacterium]|jgi:hypothetical protein|nr:hypothetical protein [Prolixibacteraceae bacterium]
MLILNTYLFFRINKQRVNLEQVNANYNTIKKQYDVFNASITSRMILSIRNDGKAVESNLLNKIDVGDSVLYLRLNSEQCQACLSSILNSISNLSEDSRRRIVILGTFNTKTEFLHYLHNLIKNNLLIEIKCEILRNSQLEENKMSYFFTIDEKKKMRNIFIPDKNFSFLTDSYLKNILRCIN